MFRFKLQTKLFFILVAITFIPLLITNLFWLNLAQNFLQLSLLSQLNLPLFMLAGLFLILSFIILALFWFSRKIINPIEKLLLAIQIIGMGDLKHRAELSGDDEVQKLALGINNMAISLQLTLDKLSAQSQMADKSAQLLLGRDLDLRKTNDELELQKEGISAEKNKLAIILSGISDAVIALDLHRNIVLFNKAAETLINLKEQEVVGKPIQQIIRLYLNNVEISLDDFCPENKIGFEGVVYSKPTVKLVSFKPNQAEEEKEIFVNLISGQIREGRRVNLGCILTLHDISAEKQLEKMKLDFVSMAAHELRTPLTAIKGYLSVFIKENTAKFTLEQNMFMTRINIATSQLTGLIENLLNVSKIERGVFDVNVEPINWIELAKTVFDQFGERAKEKHIEYIFLPPSQNLPKVKADKLRIAEVIANLLSNAISYTQEKGKITLWIETQKSQVITHITDNGEGIPKQAMPKLFSKFFRVSGNLEQGSKGTGLGLYIAKSIVQMHHGQIWVESELGRGTTFSFSLPLAEG